jgi:hypothetical protein
VDSRPVVLMCGEAGKVALDWSYDWMPWDGTSYSLRPTVVALLSSCSHPCPRPQSNGGSSALHVATEHLALWHCRRQGQEQATLLATALE